MQSQERLWLFPNIPGNKIYIGKQSKTLQIEYEW